MLSKRKRLLVGDFKKGKEKRKYIRMEFLMVCSYVDLRNSEARFAVVVSKKVLKKAFQRNREKRRLYSIIREYYPQFCQNKSYIFTLKKDTRDVPTKDLVAAVEEYIRKTI